ncbi:MAG TPA: SIMPL domain-containing protein [Acidimicrobiia bacterium]
MKRSTWAIIAGAALVFAACGGTTAGANQVTVPANESGAQMAGISVSGTGEITGTPDTVSVDVGVSVLGNTVDEATSKAADAANAVIDSLKANGVDPEAITTTNYSIYPEYDYRSDAQVLLGYRVNNTVRAKISDVTNSGSVIDDASKAAGDAATVSGISFSIEDDAAMVEAAREAAWNDAFKKASQLAELSGQKLGPVISISESVSRPPVPIAYENLQAADGATPIEPGAASVSIGLQVEFSFSS